MSVFSKKLCNLYFVPICKSTSNIELQNKFTNFTQIYFSIHIIIRRTFPKPFPIYFLTTTYCIPNLAL